VEKEESSTLSLNVPSEMSNRNNIPEKKCHSFGDKSDEDFQKADSFKSESLGSPSPKNKHEEQKNGGIVVDAQKFGLKLNLQP